MHGISRYIGLYPQRSLLRMGYQPSRLQGRRNPQGYLLSDHVAAASGGNQPLLYRPRRPIRPPVRRHLRGLQPHLQQLPPFCEPVGGHFGDVGVLDPGARGRRRHGDVVGAHRHGGQLVDRTDRLEGAGRTTRGRRQNDRLTSLVQKEVAVYGFVSQPRLVMSWFRLGSTFSTSTRCVELGVYDQKCL